MTPLNFGITNPAAGLRDDQMIEIANAYDAIAMAYGACATMYRSLAAPAPARQEPLSSTPSTAVEMTTGKTLAAPVLVETAAGGDPAETKIQEEEPIDEKRAPYRPPARPADAQGAGLRVARLALGLSQYDVSDILSDSGRIPVTQTMLSKMERRGIPERMETVVRAAFGRVPEVRDEKTAVGAYLHFTRAMVLKATRAQIAEKAGVSVEAVKTWETGQYRPSPDKHDVIKQIYGKSPDEIVDLLNKNAVIPSVAG